MNNNDLKIIVEARARLIRLFGKLDGRQDQFAMINQRDVAHEIGATIKIIDKFLEGKVKFQ